MMAAYRSPENYHKTSQLEQMSVVKSAFKAVHKIQISWISFKTESRSKLKCYS